MSVCAPEKDFLRHIVNRVLSENIAKIPVMVVNDIRKKFGRAEDKFKFTIFGGDPRRLVDYFRSEEWRDLVDLARSLHVEWILELVLESLASEYKASCPPVAEEARRVLEELRKGKGRERARLDIDTIYRSLKLMGFKVEKTGDNAVVVEEPFMTVRMEVSDNKISYRICREGKASTLDAVLAKMEKIREL